MTSTLQQEGGRQLRWSSSQVMRVAQGLYERGYITYMRTDAVVLSDEALQAVRAAITSEYGASFLSPSPRRYTSRVKNAQEAHEAIRPTTPLRSPQQVAGELNGHELALYRLIWQRTLASQMADATGHTVTVRIGATADRRPRRRVLRLGDDDHVPGLPPGVRRGPRRGRRRHCRRRARGAAAAAGERATSSPSTSLEPRGHATTRAAALHRGVARQAPGGARHRPTVDVGVDHPDDPGPRLRVEEGPGARADVDGVRRRRPARAALRRARRLRLHRQGGDRPRRHRRRPAEEGRVAARVLLRRGSGQRRRPARAQAARRGEPRQHRRRGDQHVPDRPRRRRQPRRRQAGPLSARTSSAATTRPAYPTTSRPTS